MASLEKEYLRFKGRNYFRHRLLLSCLSMKNIIIEDIRDGIKDYEKEFLELLDKITNGTIISISDTGKAVRFTPGILYGTNQPIEFYCSPSRGIGYFLEPLFILAPFCKYPVDITFIGVTNNDLDPSYDVIRYSLLFVLKKFFINDEGLSLKLIKRGLPPNGNGIIHLTCPVRKSLKAFQWEEIGKVKKIRGTVFTCNVSPTVGNRVLESAKSIFNKILSDVYFTCDNQNNRKLSPGYGLCCVAETHKGSVFSSEFLCSSSDNKSIESEMTPEILGEKAAHLLLDEIYKCGVVDTLAQPLILAFMVFGPKDVSKVVLGPLSSYAMNFMSLINEFLNIKFQIEPHKDVSFTEEKEYNIGATKLLLTCLGIGYSNFNKPQL